MADVIAKADTDIIALQGFDYDLTGAALAAFIEVLEGRGVTYPHSFALRPNTGMPTGLDMDGDGRLGGPRDAQGYGRFSGQGGMAVLSRFAVLESKVRDFSHLLWRDIPGAELPQIDGTPFPSAEAQAAQRLSTTGHWAIPFALTNGTPFTALVFHATPPVFDGPEDRNGLRNRDEVRFWQVYLDNHFGTAPQNRFVILGDANLDPDAGDGRRETMAALLGDPRLQDPAPTSAGAAHVGDATDTADFSDPTPGNLRTDYVLPSQDLDITAQGVIWPTPSDPFSATVSTASRHRLVWVDISTD